MECQKGFNLPILVRVRPSRGLIKMILVIHCLSPGPLFYSDLALWFCLSVSFLLIIHYRWLQKYVLNNNCQLMMRSRDDWLLTSGSDQFMPVDLLPGSFVHPFLTVLRFRHQQGCSTVILTGDNVDPEQYRRLRVFLRFPPAK